MTASARSPTAGDGLEAVWRYLGPAVVPHAQLVRRHLRLIDLDAGESLADVGDDDPTMFLIAAGQVALTEDDAVCRMLGPGEAFAEVALLSGERQVTAATARDSTTLAALPRHALGAIDADDPAAGEALREVVAAHVRSRRLSLLVGRTGIFRRLDDEVRDELVAELELLSVAAGETLIREGDPADSLYVVISGRLRVRSEATGADLAEPGAGQTVGEMGLITGDRRTATVSALRDSLVARLTRDAFDRLLRRHPAAVMAQFVAPLVTVLGAGADGDSRSRGQHLVIAVVGRDQDTPLAGVVEGLSDGLGGSVLHLGADEAGARLGDPSVVQSQPGEPRHDELVLWLNDLQARHEVVVYEADHRMTAWTRRCLRQADVVLLVAAADRPAAAGPVEEWMTTAASMRGTHRHLVLVHAAGVGLPPPGTGRRSDPAIESVHHVRAGSRTDLARVGRLLTGRGVGLVLSGGGARALAHVGVIRALDEAGIPIDVVGAVSGGAIVAGLHALGLDPTELTRRAEESVARIDYTLPVHALTSGRNWTASMRLLFGDVAIEDLWVPFYCTSANLSQGRQQVHTSGSLMHAVRASTAIPGLLPPVFHDGDVLVDGGLIDNLPTGLMQARADVGRVIAVDVGGADPRWLVPPFDYEISGWRSLAGRFGRSRRAPSVPTLPETLLRSISLSNTASSRADRGIDLYIQPPVQGFKLMDFHDARALSAVGYDHAVDQLAEAGIGAAWSR